MRTEISGREQPAGTDISGCEQPVRTEIPRHEQPVKIEMPDKVKFVIRLLAEAGFEAYAVGGCIRDSILGRIPKDWDITTNASPEEVKRIFKRTIDTGIEHGTVTVMLDREGFEVTTYRIDGKYEDNRHPSSVVFTRNLKDDLLRRDFTINAMAYNEKEGLVDLFGGIFDLHNGIIRAVGNPDERFREDALRIMRAVRFAAELGFDIEAETFGAMKKFAPNLQDISAERIRVELQKLIMGPYPEKISLAVEAGITDIVFPEWNEAVKTEQENKYHIYNVADHIIQSVKAMQELLGMCEETGIAHTRTDENACAGKPEAGAGEYSGSVEKAEMSAEKHALGQAVTGEACGSFTQKERQILCLTMLLHDIGKPAVKSMKNGQAHFYGHQEISAEMAGEILHRLKYDNETIAMVKTLVLHHDDRFRYGWKKGSADARRLAGKIGMEALKMLIPVQYADALAHSPVYLEKNLQRIADMKRLCEEITEKQQCVTLKELAVSGKDLIEIGAEPGPELGRILKELLALVIENPDFNNREFLLKRAAEFAKQFDNN